MKIFIVEDEIPSIDWLIERLNDLEEGIEVVGIAHTIEEALAWLNDTSQQKADIIFMDIQLTDGLSFEILRQSFISAPIIFTTAYDTYALEAFKVYSIDYLLKPINTKELRRSLEKYRQFFTQKTATHDGERNQPSNENVRDFVQQLLLRSQQQSARFLVQQGTKLISLQAQEIAYCYAEQKLTYIITHEGKRYIKGEALDELQELLPHETFFRLNRQYIANITSIKEVQTGEYGKLNVLFCPTQQQGVAGHQMRTTVSRERASAFKIWFGK
jgi:DNA-binding LytR/AlgR family response regulator